MKKKKKTSSRWTKLFLMFCFIFVVIAVAGGTYLLQGLPSLSVLENPKTDIATRIYSEDGELLDQLFIENRTKI